MRYKERISHHDEMMLSNLRMREEADKQMAWDSCTRFLAEAAHHAAIATNLRAILSDEVR